MLNEVVFITSIIIGILIPLIIIYYSETTANIYIKFYFDKYFNIEFILKTLATIVALSLYINYSYKFYIDFILFDIFRNHQTTLIIILICSELLLLFYIIKFVIKLYKYKKQSYYYQVVGILDAYIEIIKNLSIKYNWGQSSLGFKGTSNKDINILNSKYYLNWIEYDKSFKGKTFIYKINHRKLEKRFENCFISISERQNMTYGRTCVYYSTKMNIAKRNKIKDYRFLKNNIKLGEDYQIYLVKIIENISEDLLESYRCKNIVKIQELHKLFIACTKTIHSINNEINYMEYTELIYGYLKLFRKFNNEIDFNSEWIYTFSIKFICSLFDNLKQKTFIKYLNLFLTNNLLPTNTYNSYNSIYYALYTILKLSKLYEFEPLYTNKNNQLNLQDFIISEFLSFTDVDSKENAINFLKISEDIKDDYRILFKFYLFHTGEYIKFNKKELMYIKSKLLEYYDNKIPDDLYKSVKRISNKDNNSLIDKKIQLMNIRV